jgi:hypothetical protein
MHWPKQRRCGFSKKIDLMGEQTRRRKVTVSDRGHVLFVAETFERGAPDHGV